MNILDIIIGVFLLAFAFNGLRKGLIKSVLGLLGLIIIILLIVKIGHPVKLMLINQFNINEILALILAYILIIFFITIIFKLIGVILSKIISVLNAGCIDRVLGVIFGLLNGLLIISIILIVIDLSPLKDSVRKATRDTFSIQFIRKFTYEIDKKLPEAKEIRLPLEKSMEDIKEKVNETLEKK
jgi:membrane protein required for colicin V production